MSFAISPHPISRSEATMNFIEQYGRSVADNGYPFIPIMPGSKVPGRFMSGRWQALSGWTSRWSVVPSAFETGVWSKSTDAGIGIMGGLVCAIDIDVKDAVAALQIEQLAYRMLGDTPLLRIGSAPKRMLIYRTDKPFNGFKKHPLEVLCKGQQFVAYAIHPNTGQPYTWPGDGPHSVDMHDLPPINEKMARAFMAEAFKMVPLKLRQKALSTESKYDDNGTANTVASDLRGTYEGIAAALAFIPNDDLNYDDWIRIGLAIKGALGEDGGQLFAEWSDRSAKNVPDTTGKAWAGFKPERIGAGTIYEYALRNGWVPPADIILNAEQKELQAKPHPAQGLLDRIMRGEIRAKSADDSEDVKEGCVVAAPSSPVGIYAVTGILKEFTDWINATSIRRQPKLALAAAITTIGAIAGRRYAFLSPKGLRTNIYAIGICDSGGGKDHPRKCVKEALMEAGLAHFFGGEKVASGQAILTMLTTHPARIMLPDEFGHFVSKVFAKNAAGHVREIGTIMTEMFTSANSVVIGTEYANNVEKPRQDIINPHLAIYASTAPGPLWKALESGALEDGFAARWLIFESDMNYPDSATPPNIPIPSTLVDSLKRIAAGGAMMGGNLGNCSAPNATPNIFAVPANDEAMAALERLSQDNTAQLREAEGTSTTSIFARLYEHVVKVAMIGAISDNPVGPVVTADHVAWAKATVQDCMAKLIKNAEEHVADNEHEAAVKRVMSIIKAANGITKNELVRKTQFLKRRDRDEIIASLVEAESVRIENHNTVGGRPKTVILPS
jgi:hypothetical protein